MKKYALICLLAALSWVAGAQTKEQKDVPDHGAKIRFEEMEHNYGTVMKGGNGDCQFTFWNDGDEPLILQTVKASCGCTTPRYTQKPVMPGQKGVIDVHYNTNNVGGFSKTVTVTSNAVNSPRVVLRIKGTVQQDAKPTPAPAVNPKKDAPVVVEPKPLVAEDARKPQKMQPREPMKKEPLKTAEPQKVKPQPVADIEKLPLKLTPEQEKAVTLVNEGLKRNKMALNSAEMELSGDAVEAIKHLAEELQGNPELRVAVTGHTCNVGSSEANMRVGMKRARAAKALLESYGVPADRIEVFSKGENEPAFSNDTEEGRIQNRRVVVEIVK